MTTSDSSTATKTASERRRLLGTFDFTLLVIGAVIGADVYIVGGSAAGYLGPAQLVAWLVAGVMAAVIALAFVQCAAIQPKVGGSYAYARAAFGPLAGFVTGWALYLGEWVALPVFPIVFVNYLGTFLPHLSAPERRLIELLLIVAVTGVNIAGVHATRWTNDVLTIAKLVPLALLIVAGLAFIAVQPHLTARHLTPFAPLGWGWRRFGSATVLVFWAYAGFEVSVLPASEVRQPRRTLPRGLILGMAIVTVFYVLDAVALVVTLPWHVAATSPHPLSDALQSAVTGLGWATGLSAAVMSLGGLISIASVYNVGTLTLASLSYAMAKDGIIPSAFAKTEAHRGSPLVGLLFQAASTTVVALFFNVTVLIATAVFFLGICYTMTALAALRLAHHAPERRLRVPALRPLLALGALGGIYLAVQAPPLRLLVGAGVMLLGLAFYAWRSGDWRKLAAAASDAPREERQFERWAHQRGHWLARSLRRDVAEMD